MKKQWKWGLAVAGLVVWGTLAAVFGLYDLQISQAAYDPTARWAKWFEFAGYLVTPVILAWGAHFLLYRKTRKRRSSLIWIGHCLLATAMLTAIFFLAGGINGWVRFGVIGTAYLAGLLIILLKSWRLDDRRLNAISRIVWRTFAGCAAVFLVVTVLKTCAGRVRFRELQDLSAYSPWFQWHPLSGNYSFPSGHTANASGVFGFVLLAPLVRARWKRVVLCVTPFLFTAVMGMSRVVAGAHYASDVLFGMGIAVLVFFALQAVADFWRKKHFW
ncbi:MAG: phosphatase PAP2 family protein [Massilioclostridium sp.]|nr:phosphatase PAP2 family protein [Massilioclostridium sp.]